MKKMLSILCAIMIIVSLTACSSDFDGSRTGNDNEFSMEYKVLNKTDSQDLKLQDGDKINAKIIIDGGTLAIKIQKDDEEPIYESDGISASNEFEVEVEESGIYTITVTGKKAKGSVNFTVVSVE
ncbi:MAG: hypothetical protein MR789_05080 [Gemmiger formicilis]|uniref:LptM family lipoprotein n=1 Tax=Gemmiger formicilis TaxID=745368 RepID=UPI003FF10C73|nr:hypothetical protein [Gemmiger formicilis]